MLLALDTSTAQLGLALYDGAQVVAESVWRSHARHTVELAPALDEIFRCTGLRVEDVRALGIALGPGSFTSLRVGLAFAKGLALARTLPLVGIPTLDVAAACQPPERLPLGCLLQAGRGRLALGWYQAHENGWQASGSLNVVTAEALAQSIAQETLLCGELSAAECRQLAENPQVRLVSAVRSVRRPALLAELAWARWQSGQVDDLASLAPIYLHVAESIPS